MDVMYVSHDALTIRSIKGRKKQKFGPALGPMKTRTFSDSHDFA